VLLKIENLFDVFVISPNLIRPVTMLMIVPGTSISTIVGHVFFKEY
jgi:hypothetical protein